VLFFGYYFGGKVGSFGGNMVLFLADVLEVKWCIFGGDMALFLATIMEGLFSWHYYGEKRFMMMVLGVVFV